MTSATHFLSIFPPASWSGRVMFSSAVSIGSRLKNWKTNPTFRRRSFVSSVSFSLEIGMPAIETSPVVGWSSPAMMCMSVDLPEPDGPMIETSSALATSSVTPRSASTAVSPSP
jgi:hypothetical protein